MEARYMGDDVITKDISANQHFASTFAVQIFKFQRRSCKLSFLFPPRHQSAPESLLVGYGTGGWKEKIRVLQTGVEPMNSCSVAQMLYYQATGGGGGGSRALLYFWTKLRPEGPKKNFSETVPSPYLRVWMTAPPPPPPPPLS